MSLMGVDWASERDIGSFEELLAVLGHPDRTDLQDEFELRMVDIGPLDWLWHNAMDLSARVGNGFVGVVPFESEFPLTLADLAADIDNLNERLAHRAEAAELPTAHDLVDVESGRDGASTIALATFFAVPVTYFVDALCGGWRPVSVARNTAVVGTDDPLRWFGAGQPLQVLLGIGEDVATLGRPIETHAGLAGPATLEVSDLVDVDLRQGPSTLNQLSTLVTDVCLATRADWDFCPGCLDYGPPGPVGRYCAACTHTYLGTIVD